MAWRRLLMQVARQPLDLLLFSEFGGRPYFASYRYRDCYVNRFGNLQQRSHSSYVGSFSRIVRDADGTNDVALLKELYLRNDPEEVIKLFESQPSLHLNPSAVAEYVRALVKVNRLDESSLLKTLQRGTYDTFQAYLNTEAPSKIFLINCLSAIQQPLSKHDVAAKYVSSLGSVIETHVNILVVKEVDTILRRCGLSSKMVYIHKSMNEDAQSHEVGPLSEIEEMSPPLLSECLRLFFGIISGREGSLPEFEQMQVPGLRSEVVLRVARALADAYELVYNAVIDPKNHYPEPRSLVRHLPDHIRTILGI